MEKKLVSFRLPEELMWQLKKKAQEDGVTVTELICGFSYDGLRAELPRSDQADLLSAIAAPESLGVSTSDFDKVVDIRVHHLEKQVKELRRALERQAQELDKMRNRFLEELLDLLKEKNQWSQTP